MKKQIIRLFSLVIFCLLVSCEKEEKSKVTIYVANAGDKQVSDHIVAEIGDFSENFFTPESRNMSLSECNEYASNSAHFDLVPGTYSYKVTGGRGKWNGTFTVGDGECKLIELKY